MNKNTIVIIGMAMLICGFFAQRALRGTERVAGVSSSSFFQRQVNAFAAGSEPRKNFKVAAGANKLSDEDREEAQPWMATASGAGSLADENEDESSASLMEARVLAELKKPLSSVEVESVADMMNTFASHVADGTTPADLVKQLERAGLEPVTALDENADTGKMVVVRTEGALPGTRYFHAQFFEDEQGHMQAQHLSFEIRPGKDSEEVAQKMIRDTYQGIGEPTNQKGCFREWKLKGCKTVSMKCMSASDLTDSPFNAYSISTDVGTVRVSQEDDPHCHESAAEH